MSQPSVRSRFLSTYDALPSAARRDLLEEHLLPLLDGVSLVDQMRLISIAESAQARFADMPRLDLAAKKAEMDTLLEELKRDVCCRTKSSSQREEIYEQIVDSLVSWLSDIWQVAFEYGTDYPLAHECLLFCSTVLLQVSTAGPSCNCEFVNMYIPFTIKDRSGNIVKHFSYPGAHFLEDAFLWIWRDMLLNILTQGKQRDAALIPQMLMDIQVVFKDWTPLDRLLLAGGKIPSDDNEDDSDSDYEEEESDGDSINCPSHAAHWSPTHLTYLHLLRTHVANALLACFHLAPSFSLYNATVLLAPALRDPLLAHIHAAMLHSAPAAAAALDIHTSAGDAPAVMRVLAAAQPILRPRDAPAMQEAVHILPAHAALAIITRELHDCVKVMRGHVGATGAFGGVERAEARAQLAEVLRIRQNTHQRQERVERWVDDVVTAAPSAGNPLTFAAFIMGFPPDFSPDDTSSPDPFLFAGINDSDPEYVDLREEWRPRLKERFEGWVSAAEAFGAQGGEGVLRGLVVLLGEAVPFVVAGDVVDEMITRIQDKPTRYHICDALEALSSFMKAQHRKAALEKARAEKRRTAPTGGAGGGAGKKARRTRGDVNGAGPSTYVNDHVLRGLEALD